MNLIQGDCLEKLKGLEDKSVDFVYLDLPYGQTACKWDVKLDLGALWQELKRIARNDRTPFFFSCTTKFGFELIKANEKWFRWDLVWKKNRAAGFLNAYKLPMRKHEMVYCFAKKSPEYDVSSHKTGETTTGTSKGHVYLKEFQSRGQDESYFDKNHTKQVLSEPLPTSDITPPTPEHELVYCFAKKLPEYDVSSHITGEEVVKPSCKEHISMIEMTGGRKCMMIPHKSKVLSEPLPTSDITPPELDPNGKSEIYGIKKTGKRNQGKKDQEPLPTSDITFDLDDEPSSWCEFKNDEKTGHRTAKPVALMEFLLKYWTKPDATVLDPTMGSGSMGIACKKMGRKFIGIEMDKDIYELAVKRIG